MTDTGTRGHRDTEKMPRVSPSPRLRVMSLLSLWGPVIVVCGIIFYLSGIPNLRLVESWWDYPIRKAGHMAEYALLARLLARALGGSTSWPWKKIFYASLALCFLYACSDEYHQMFVNGRIGSPRDLVFDTVGAWLALGLRP